MPTEDWKYQISLALPEGTSDATVSALYDIVEAALKERDERAVRIIREHRESNVCEDNCWTTISTAIRNEDTDA